MDAQTKRRSGDELGATMLFPTLSLGNDPETRRGMLGATHRDGLWEPADAVAGNVSMAATRGRL